MKYPTARNARKATKLEVIVGSYITDPDAALEVSVIQEKIVKLISRQRRRIYDLDTTTQAIGTLVRHGINPFSNFYHTDDIVEDYLTRRSGAEAFLSTNFAKIRKDRELAQLKVEPTSISDTQESIKDQLEASDWAGIEVFEEQVLADAAFRLSNASPDIEPIISDGNVFDLQAYQLAKQDVSKIASDN